MRSLVVEDEPNIAAFLDRGLKVVDVYIRYLRRKIDDGFDIKLIKTVRGVGYMLG